MSLNETIGNHPNQFMAASLAVACLSVYCSAAGLSVQPNLHAGGPLLYTPSADDPSTDIQVWAQQARTTLISCSPARPSGCTHRAVGAALPAQPRRTARQLVVLHRWDHSGDVMLPAHTSRALACQRRSALCLAGLASVRALPCLASSCAWTTIETGGPQLAAGPLPCRQTV